MLFKATLLTRQAFKEKVCILGSGNWGSAIAKIVGKNVQKLDNFDKEVRMWVHEEIVRGEKLSAIINNTHYNVKYLPGIPLPTNVVAVPEITHAAKDATLLIFVIPHQFVKQTCQAIRHVVNTRNARAISLIKGIDVAGNNSLHLISSLIHRSLNGIDVSVLMVSHCIIYRAQILLQR